LHCRNCDYPLWNLKDRQCPECGAAFVPGAFEFPTNAVRFCCPHCDTAYYGVGAHGHLEPKRFTCAGCGREVDMDEMVLRPAEGVDVASIRHNRMPWFDRQPGQIVRPWLATLGAVMTRPTTVVAGIPREHSVLGAWAFMFISNLIFRVVGQLPWLLISIGFIWFMGRQMPAMGPLMPMMMQQMAFFLPLSLIMLAIVPVAWFLLAHGLLRLTGSAREPWQRTAHCICYASGANAPSAIPCGDCAMWAGAAWWVVSAILMVKDAHRCSGGMATLAVLVSGLLVMIVTTAVTLLASLSLMGGPFSNFATFGQEMDAREQAQVVAEALQQYASDHEGSGPDHAVQLIDARQTPPSSFCVTTPANSVLVGGTMLAQFPQQSGEAREEAIDAATEALPPGVVAHRLGDMVFTYHGADLTRNDSKLWVLVVAPSPATPAASTWNSIVIVRGDETMGTVTAAEFPEALAEQNNHRRTLGLPPLPGNLLTFPPSTPPTANGAAAAPPRDDRTAADPQGAEPDADQR